MKTIELKGGKIALVDDPDFAVVSKHKWYATDRGSAIANIDGKTVQMHRLIMNPLPGLWVDHKNHDRLDNRRSNLRIATPQQNNANKRSYSKTGFKGVVDMEARPCSKPVKRHSKTLRKRYRATIQNRVIGYFDNPVDAAKAYEAEAVRIFGDFACTKRI